VAAAVEPAELEPVKDTTATTNPATMVSATGPLVPGDRHVAGGPVADHAGGPAAAEAEHAQRKAIASSSRLTEATAAVVEYHRYAHRERANATTRKS